MEVDLGGRQISTHNEEEEHAGCENCWQLHCGSGACVASSILLAPPCKHSLIVMLQQKEVEGHQGEVAGHMLSYLGREKFYCLPLVSQVQHLKTQKQVLELQGPLGLPEKRRTLWDQQ